MEQFALGILHYTPKQFYSLTPSQFRNAYLGALMAVNPEAYKKELEPPPEEKGKDNQAWLQRMMASVKKQRKNDDSRARRKSKEHSDHAHQHETTG